MAWGAAIGAGASAISGMFGAKKAKKKQSQYMHIAAENYLKQLGLAEVTAGKQIQLANKNLGTVQAGLAKAKGGLQASGYTAKQGIQSAGQQALGKIAQGMTNKGLGNTTLTANLQKGVAFDTAQSMAAVDEAFGKLMADFELAGASAEISANDAIAKAYGNKYLMQSQAHQGLASLYGGTQVALPQPFDFGGLGTALGDIFKWAGKNWGGGGAAKGQAKDPYNPLEWL